MLKTWPTFILACISALCLRFIVGAWVEARPDWWPTVILTCGGTFIAFWRPTAAFFAFTAALFWINGLGQAVLLKVPAPVSLLAATLIVGTSFRSVLQRFSTLGREPNPKSTIQGSSQGWVMLTINLIATAVLFSLAFLLWRHREAPDFWAALWTRSSFGFGERYYFLSSALIWLQGLWYFRFLLVEADLVDRLRPVYLVYTCTFVVFFLVQFATKVPVPLSGHAYSLPGEDISSFGSVAVALFAFFLALSAPNSRWESRVNRGCAIAMLALLVASWSRAAWLSGLIVLLALAWLKLPRKLAVASLVLLGLLILGVNLQPERLSQKNPYFFRLTSLLRIENPASKAPSRMNLYLKAIDMIRDRPLTGHGIGSYYRTSVAYARAGDPHGTTPDFAHNTFLQVAAELGVGVAALLAGLIVWGLLRSPLAPPAVALIAYLLTQMTANSLNVYPSNQFFFWLLLASLMARPLTPHPSQRD